YLDPGYRTRTELEEIEKPSFENFLSKPGNLTDHLLWQLGAISVRPPVREAAETVIGNLSEDGYLIASDEEVLGVAPAAAPEADAEAQAKIVGDAQAIGLEGSGEETENLSEPISDEATAYAETAPDAEVPVAVENVGRTDFLAQGDPAMQAATEPAAETEKAATASGHASPVSQVNFAPEDLHEALEIVRLFDPPGVACRDLRECLTYQLRYHLSQLQNHRNGHGGTEQIIRDAMAVVDQHLRAVTLKQFKEIGRAIGRPVEAVM